MNPDWQFKKTQNKHQQHILHKINIRLTVSYQTAGTGLFCICGAAGLSWRIRRAECYPTPHASNSRHRGQIRPTTALYVALQTQNCINKSPKFFVIPQPWEIHAKSIDPRIFFMLMHTCEFIPNSPWKMVKNILGLWGCWPRPVFYFCDTVASALLDVKLQSVIITASHKNAWILLTRHVNLTPILTCSEVEFDSTGGKTTVVWTINHPSGVTAPSAESSECLTFVLFLIHITAPLVKEPCCLLRS